MSLTYVTDGSPRPATRGDGVSGEDVNRERGDGRRCPAPFAPSRRPYPRHLEVRGEVYMPTVAFDAMNERQRAAGEREFVNPATRPPALSARGPDDHRHRALAFWAYRSVRSTDVRPEDATGTGSPSVAAGAPEPSLELLRAAGLPVSPDARRVPDTGGSSPLCAAGQTPPRLRLRDRRLWSRSTTHPA